jgi:4-amino-4-deoxy-L-arabinose transferase-like glycosyltransferase
MKILKSNWFLISGFISLAFAIRIGRLNDSIFEISEFRQTQTAFGIRSIAENDLNILQAQVPVFGPPWQVPFEFPIYQWISAIFSNSFNLSTDFSGRLVGTLFFLSTSIALYKLVKNLAGNFSALVSLPIFLFSSFGIQWGSTVLIEWSSTAFLLWGLYLLIKHVEMDKLFSFWLAASIIFMGTASLIKITTTIPWVIAFSLYLLPKTFSKRQLKIWATWILGLAFSYLPTFAWTRYADNVKSQNPLTVWLTSDNLSEWNFGIISQRIDPDTWVTITKTADQTVFGSLILFFTVAIIYILTSNKNQKEFLLFFSIIGIAPLLFTNLYAAHMYYLSAIYPAMVAAIAIVFTGLLKDYSNRLQKLVVAIPIFIILFLGYTSDLGRFYLQNFQTDNGIPPASQLILDNTPEDSKIIVMGCDWDPHTLYFANRKGLMLLSNRFPEIPIEVYKLNDYDYFYACNEEIKGSIPGSLNLKEIKNNLYLIIK